MQKKFLFLIIVLLSYFATSVAVASEENDIPVEQWNKTFGFANVNSHVQNSNGEYFLAGNNNFNAFLIKTDSNGNELWNKTFNKKNGNSIQQTIDGGCVMAGSASTSYFKDDGSYIIKDDESWLIKVDKNGDEIWNKTFGGALNGELFSVIHTSDGGYAMAGMNHKISQSALLIKTDSEGNKQWYKTFGGGKRAYSVVEDHDGGFVIGGNNIMRNSNSIMGSDIFIIKTDSSGNQKWSKTFDKEYDDIAHSVLKTNDEGFVLAGASGGDILLIKTDSSGNEEWSKTFAGKDVIKSVVQTIDGGYALAVTTFTFGSSGNDAHLIKTDSNGNIEWNITLGGNGSNSVNSILESMDGSYVLAGGAQSGGAWLIKVGKNVAESGMFMSDDLEVKGNITNESIEEPTAPSTPAFELFFTISSLLVAFFIFKFLGTH
jgi:hypothetical protein